jgi:uncharacterized protein (TIGR03437 family)
MRPILLFAFFCVHVQLFALPLWFEPNGANQINLQLPDGLASGPLTIVLTAGDAASKPFVWNRP